MSAGPFDVVGLGLNAMDTICVVERFPEPHSKIPIRQVRMEPGGQVATALVSCSRLGLKTRYLGTVGSDANGTAQLASLKQEQVEVKDVRIVNGAASQSAVILLVEGVGERTILWHRDPRLQYPAEAVRADIIRSGRMLHLDGCDTAASLKAARIAREAEIPVVIDIDELYGRETEELLGLVDYLVAAEDFAAAVTGRSDPEDAARALSHRFGCRVVGITLGARGAIFVENNRLLRSAAFRVPVVDTTGAGDVFHGGVIYGLLQSWPLEDTIRFAHAVAGLKCGKIGARAGIPRLAEVKRFLAATDDN